MLPSPDPCTRCHYGRRLGPCSRLGVTTRPPPSSWRLEHPRPWPQLRGLSARLAPKLVRLGLRILHSRNFSGAGGPGASSPPPSPAPRLPLLPSFFLGGRSSPRSGEFPRVTRRRIALAFPSRLHLDIICERSCPQDDHAGRRCAQDDAARPGAELPTQRLPAGRYVRASAHPDPGARDWLPHPIPGLQGLESRLPRSLFLHTSHPKKQWWGGGLVEGREAPFRFQTANAAPCSLQTLRAGPACSGRFHFALFWSCCREEEGG